MTTTARAIQADCDRQSTGDQIKLEVFATANAEIELASHDVDEAARSAIAKNTMSSENSARVIR